MSNVVRSRNAHQLFDKFTKRRPPSRTSNDCTTHVPFGLKQPNLVDPYEYFNHNDVLKSWTSKISSLVRENRPQEAVATFKKMFVHGQRPNFVTVLSVIKAVGLIGSRNLVCGIHGYSVKMGFVESQVPVVTALVGVYSCWDMGSAWKLFDWALNKDVVLCSAMVSACVSNGEYVEAIKLLKEMANCGVPPNYVTISSVLPACSELSALNLGREIHGYSIKRTLYCYTILLNSLVDMYSKCRHLGSALQVFRDMSDKDIVSWRIMVRGCVENESPGKALKFFCKLQTCGVEKVDEHIIQEAIGACSKLDENCSRCGFHSFVLKTGFILFVSVATELLQVYAKFENIESAGSIFAEINKKDLIAWSAMIAVYAQSTQPLNAFDVLRQMQMSDQKPNEFTFASLLLACTSAAAIEVGESIHAQITRYGYSTNTFLTSALIDMYCKFGRTSQGKAVFHEDPTRDFICWSSMINGYGINGCGEEVLECFSNMLSDGIEPNDVVFISVLSACSHCGLDYEGWNWFYAMETTYGIKPRLAHYACMVDMLSRQGNIEEAFEFVKNMPIQPDKRIWGAMLAGCRNTNEHAEILEFVANKLFSLDPENASYYVVLSNLYADQGRWKEVEKLRSKIDSKSLKKVIGHSTI